MSLNLHLWSFGTFWAVASHLELGPVRLAEKTVDADADLLWEKTLLFRWNGTADKFKRTGPYSLSYVVIIHHVIDYISCSPRTC